MVGTAVFVAVMSTMFVGFASLMFVLGLFLFVGLLITGIGLAIGVLLGSIVVAVIIGILFILISIPLLLIFIASFTALRGFIWIYRIMIGWWSCWGFIIAFIYYGINLLEFEEKPDSEYQNNTRFDNAQ